MWDFDRNLEAVVVEEGCEVGRDNSPSKTSLFLFMILFPLGFPLQMGKVVSWWLWCDNVWVPHGLLLKGSSFLFILHKSQRDIKMSQCSAKTNSCSHCTPGQHPQMHILQFTQRRSSAALSYRNCHVSWYYLSSCRWPRAASSRLISWMAGSWSCWFRYWVAYLQASYSLK